MDYSVFKNVSLIKTHHREFSVVGRCDVRVKLKVKSPPSQPLVGLFCDIRSFPIRMLTSPCSQKSAVPFKGSFYLPGSACPPSQFSFVLIHEAMLVEEALRGMRGSLASLLRAQPLFASTFAS